MKHTSIRVPPPDGTARRRRGAGTLGLFATVPDDRSAAAMDDAAAAARLIDDLLALVDAGLIEPIDDHGEIRYAPAPPEDLTA